MSKYIVAYTLKHRETPNTFVDYWHRFVDDTPERNKEFAQKFYADLLGNDGGEVDYHLFTVSLSQELLSSEDEGEVSTPYQFQNSNKAQ